MGFFKIVPSPQVVNERQYEIGSLESKVDNHQPPSIDVDVWHARDFGHEEDHAVIYIGSDCFKYHLSLPISDALGLAELLNQAAAYSKEREIHLDPRLAPHETDE